MFVLGLLIAALVIFIGGKLVDLIRGFQEKETPISLKYAGLSVTSVLVISLIVLCAATFPLGVGPSNILSLYAIILGVFTGIEFSKMIAVGHIPFVKGLVILSFFGLLIWPAIYLLGTSIDSSFSEVNLFRKIGIMEFTFIGISMTLMVPLINEVSERYL